MRGLLSETAIPDLCRGLSDANATGALEVQGEAGTGRVFFRDGMVYWAHSPAPRAQLGARLVNAGFITTEQLEHALEIQAAAHERTKLGALVVEQGLVSQDVVRVFVQEQILDALLDLMRWRGGEYQFHHDDAVADELPVDIPVAELLVEVARRQNEWGEVSQVIPDLDLVADHVVGGSATSAALEPDEFTMLASIDGSRSVRELAADLGYSEFEAARILYGLVILGIVQMAPPDSQPAAPQATGESDPENVEALEIEFEDAAADEPEDLAAVEARFDLDSDPTDEPQPWIGGADLFDKPAPEPQPQPERPATPSPAASAATYEDLEALVAEATGDRPAPQAEQAEAAEQTEPEPAQPPEPEPAEPREPEPPEPRPAEPEPPPAAREPEPPEPAPSPKRGDGDVSELLRELSRLALDDDVPSDPVQPPERRGPPSDRSPERADDRSDDKRKRKLFGRGP